MQVSSIDNLTERQRQVAKLIAQGLTPNQIGERLWIHPNAVYYHRKRLCKAIGVKDVHELYRFLRKELIKDGQT